MDTKYILGFLAGLIILVGGIALVSGNRGGTTTVLAKYDTVKFAQCLKEKGATFYGAFWCPHCQATKKMFGASAVKELPYVECSTPDGKGQLPICTQKGVQSYPTWEFADGSRLNGELTLEQLSQASQCPLIPVDGSAPVIPAARSTTTAATTTATSSSSSSVVPR